MNFYLVIEMLTYNRIYLFKRQIWKGKIMLEKYIKPIKIGNIEVKNNIFLAPMAGVTDIPFRKICRKFSPGLTFTEMASTKALEFKSVKTDRILNIMEDERPSVVQIFGNDKDVIRHTIEMLNEDDSIFLNLFNISNDLLFFISSFIFLNQSSSGSNSEILISSFKFSYDSG